jgi:hypothetical protein
MEATPHLVLPLSPSSSSALANLPVQSMILVTPARGPAQLWAQLADRAVRIGGPEQGDNR